jgi:hypothetical protein
MIEKMPVEFFTEEKLLINTPQLEINERGFVQLNKNYLHNLPGFNLNFEEARSPADIVFVRRLLQCASPANEYVLLVTESGVWSHREDKFILSALRYFFGESAQVIDKPGIVFRGDGTQYVSSFLFMALMSDWDFFLINRDNDRVCMAMESSHESWMRVFLANKGSELEKLAIDWNSKLEPYIEVSR